MKKSSLKGLPKILPKSQIERMSGQRVRIFSTAKAL
jgi:hypothetical protein